MMRENEEQLKYILLHESLHLQCNDTGVKLMTNIICSIYWWNPLVYLLRKDMNQSLEIRCDKLVVKYEGMSSREEYLKVLLNEYRYVTQVSMSEKKQFCGMMLFEKHTESLLERFEQLKANNMKNSRYGLALAVIIGVASLLLSYSFVLQSGFDCPIEEIETAVGTKELNPEEMYLVEYNDGSYILYSGELQQIVKFEIDKSPSSITIYRIDEDGTVTDTAYNDGEITMPNEAGYFIYKLHATWDKGKSAFIFIQRMS